MKYHVRIHGKDMELRGEVLEGEHSVDDVLAALANAVEPFGAQVTATEEGVDNPRTANM